MLQQTISISIDLVQCCKERHYWTGINRYIDISAGSARELRAVLAAALFLRCSKIVWDCCSCTSAPPRAVHLLQNEKPPATFRLWKVRFSKKFQRGFQILRHRRKLRPHSSWNSSNLVIFWKFWKSYKASRPPFHTPLAVNAQCFFPLCKFCLGGIVSSLLLVSVAFMNSLLPRGLTLQPEHYWDARHHSSSHPPLPTTSRLMVIAPKPILITQN